LKNSFAFSLFWFGLPSFKISVIRKNDPDNPIIVGTGTWSQDVNDAADDQLKDANVMYVTVWFVCNFINDVWRVSVKT
jgi:aryl-phospho-beta-D-glucosidase BglC (GH1 family)